VMTSLVREILKVGEQYLHFSRTGKYRVIEKDGRDLKPL